MKIIAGQSNLQLAESIAEHCFTKIVPAKIGTFADGECSIELLENLWFFSSQDNVHLDFLFSFDL